MLYNWSKLNESFFDNIENDIFDDNIIDNNTNNKIYGVYSFAECNTPEDFAEFIDNNIHIIDLYKLLVKYKDKLWESVKLRDNMSTYQKPTIIPKDVINDIKKWNSAYNVIYNGENIITYCNSKGHYVFQVLVYITKNHEPSFSIWLYNTNTLLYHYTINTNSYKEFLIDCCRKSLGNLTYVKDLLISTNNIDPVNESFFDDIEDDIESDSLISHTSFNKLYGVINIDDCYTKDDFITYLMNILKIEEIVNKTNDYLVKYNLYDTKTNELSIPYRGLIQCLIYLHVI